LSGAQLQSPFRGPGRAAIMAAVAELSVSVEHRSWAGGRCAVVVLSGEADVTGRVVEDVLAAESAKDPALLLVDLSAVSFMDSWSLHVVLRAMRGRQAAGSGAGLVCPSGPVRRVLELTGAGELVPVFASMAEAMRAPGPSG
jgi:anti-sigma B factor antagonist